MLTNLEQPINDIMISIIFFDAHDALAFKTLMFTCASLLRSQAANQEPRPAPGRQYSTKATQIE